MPLSTSSIDLAALPADVARRVQWELAAALKAHDHDAWMRDKCENASDAELIAAGEKEYPAAPIGLSTWYHGVSLDQETIFHRVTQGRRPVFMRGAKQVLIRRHCRSIGGSSPNGWAILVYWRALRMSRKTFFDFDEFEAWDTAIAHRLHAKYRLTNVFDSATGITYREWDGCNNLDPDAEFPRIVGGKLVYLKRGCHSHLRSLSNIVRKLDKLDEAAKRELVRRSMMERLAA